MPSILRLLLALALPLFLAAGSRAGESRLTVYTAVEPDLLPIYAKAFNAKHPDIKIQWIRDSSGPVAARLLAEKNAPRAEVVFGLSLIAMLNLDENGVLAPYRPEGYDAILPLMRDARPEPVWVGMNAWAAAVCVNRPEREKAKLPRPATWNDLLDPALKGKIVMPHPASSGTGYFLVDGWLQSMGTEAGWAFVEKLNVNVKIFTHSGARPGQMAAQGETVVGLSAEPFVLPFLRRKAPLEVIVPEGPVMWDMEVSALGKAGAQRAEAKKFLDFCASEEVARIALENKFLPARAGFGDDPALKELQGRLMKTDFQRSARDKAEVVKEWNRRFNARSAGAPTP